MSDKRTATTVAPKPEWDALPRPTLLWAGVEESGLGRRCRVVLAYEWVLPGGARDWEASPKPTYEVLAGHDALGSERWEAERLEGIPAEFFVAVARRPA